MKKNITINLCGRLYQIDEDAYELLSQYIDALRNYFKKQEGGEEIANDIEERVAELFDDLKAQGTQAITIEHVQKVIHQIGQVEEIAGEEAPEATDAPKDAANADKAKRPQGGKKFYRDARNKMLAGVLAGCAQYYGGSVDAWRWGYVVICIVWCCLLGIGPATILPFDLGFFGGIVSLSLSILSLPIAILPLLPYILTAIFTPEACTPEDVLQMKGKEVNPQNIAAEVQASTLASEKKSKVSFWNIFVGVISTGVSVCLTIGFIVALCFLVAFLAAREVMADRWWNISAVEDIKALSFPVLASGIMLLASIGVLLYCSIHAAVSSFGKTPSMHTRQRVIWFLLWVASVAGFVGCATWAVGRLAKSQLARWDREEKVLVMEEAVDTIDVDDEADTVAWNAVGDTLSGIEKTDTIPHQMDTIPTSKRLVRKNRGRKNR